MQLRENRIEVNTGEMSRGVQHSDRTEDFGHGMPFDQIFEFYSIYLLSSLTKITTALDCLNELGSWSCQYARDLAQLLFTIVFFLSK